MLVSDYQESTKNLIDSGRYDTTEDFTVVVQPFMSDMAPPQLVIQVGFSLTFFKFIFPDFKANGNPDYSYFAPDCFHFSSKGHTQAAIELWNNMVDSIVFKINFPTFSRTFFCI